MIFNPFCLMHGWLLGGLPSSMFSLWMWWKVLPCIPDFGWMTQLVFWWFISVFHESKKGYRGRCDYLQIGETDKPKDNVHRYQINWVFILTPSHWNSFFSYCTSAESSFQSLSLPVSLVFLSVTLWVHWVWWKFIGFLALNSPRWIFFFLVVPLSHHLLELSQSSYQQPHAHSRHFSPWLFPC